MAAIVEGQGEFFAVPILLKRLTQWLQPEAAIEPDRIPVRVKRDQFLNRPEEFRRHLEPAAHKCGENGWVLILLDADDDCPATKGAEILGRAKAVAPHRLISVILANREYEAWFIGAASSLATGSDFNCTAEQQAQAEQPRDAKGRLRQYLGRRYNEPIDQPEFTRNFNLDLAHQNCRSFRKLCREWQKIIAAAGSWQTPAGTR